MIMNTTSGDSVGRCTARQSSRSVLVGKGMVTTSELDAVVERYEQKVGPRNGARSSRGHGGRLQEAPAIRLDRCDRRARLQRGQGEYTLIVETNPGGQLDRLHALLVLTVADSGLAAVCTSLRPTDRGDDPLVVSCVNSVSSFPMTSRSGSGTARPSPYLVLPERPAGRKN